ncbi:uncharacterized protein LOC128921311 [Zeugodacus cucurbitae]|uniref:uncharacterized protein LOC128921311 n=1 Tax=Zeugodacus cucurbitae TaxID=28588 RepID=UPI0023D95207|nr:uncharacterized protein LOC128921311 [Zeugodacus cucurbitae]
MSELPATASTLHIQTRQRSEQVVNIELIGRISHQITGAKLPSNKQVLQLLFYNIRFVYRQLRESAKLTINAVLIFWQQARIPTKDVARCVDKLESLYKLWQKIQKTVPNKRSDAQKKIVEDFSAELDNLFDIAHRDALQNMRISEDKEFLILQRQKGRPGSMAGADMVLYRRQNRADHRIEKEMSRKRKHQQMSEVNLELNELDDFGMDYEEDIGDSEPEVAETNVKKNTKHTASTCTNRGRKHFITPRLLSALDSAKVSDGKAMHILMATAEALGHCTSDLVVNRSTLHRLREEHRRKESQRIQESFIDKVYHD